MLDKKLLLVLLMTAFLAACGGGGDSGDDSGDGSDDGDDSGVGGGNASSCSNYSNNQPVLAQTEAIAYVYDFESDSAATPSAPFGRAPEDGLVEGPDGNFYGVTRYGGVNDSGYNGDGVVFRVSPAGEMTRMHTFYYEASDGPIGTNPVGKLVLGEDCAFYGTTYSGYNGIGTVFRMTLEGDINYLAGFTAETGMNPFDRLLAASDGNFYGTTIRGGEYHNQVGDWLTGTVFKLTPQGTLTVLASFNGTNGGQPRGGLIEGSDGYLYGMTNEGGTGDNGTIFRISRDGNMVVLASFGVWDGQGDAEGNGVTGGLVEGLDGNFYGTTMYGGYYGGGTIFRVTPAGELTTVHSFNPVTVELGCNCGISSPAGPLLLASDGNFYGVTWNGASTSGGGEAGSVYRMTPAGTVTPVVYFPAPGPNQALGGLIESSDGFLYGTSYGGDDDGAGYVYRLPLSQ